MSFSTPRTGVNDAAAMMHYDANKKSAVIAYVLWFFLGYVGAHRFYAGRIGSGATMLVIWCVSFLLSYVLIGYLGFALIAVWWLVDALLIPGMISGHNRRLIASMGR